MSYSPCNCDDLDCRECGTHNREKMVDRVRGMIRFIDSKRTTTDYLIMHSSIPVHIVNEANAGEIESRIKPVAMALAEDVYAAECEAARKEAIERTLRKQCALFAE